MKRAAEYGVCFMTDIPDEKQILTAANQLLGQYNGDVLDAKLHAARLSDNFLERGDIDGHLAWLKIHRAITRLTDSGWDGETLH